MEEHRESQLRMMQRSKNFWANVSSIHVADGVPEATQLAIVRGTEKANTLEPHGRETE